MVQFLCPNGHRIHCPDEQAGRAAKCPKCGVAFKIPTLDQSGAIASASADSGSVAVKAAGEGSGLKPAGKEPQIEFLCPNGHRLHGPASMQGRPGQCPECGSKFRIPSYSDELSEEPQPSQEVGLSETGQSEAEAVDEPPPLPTSEHVAGAAPGSGLDVGEEQRQSFAPAQPGPHSWGPMFADLWTQRAAGVVIEVCFQDGQTIAPEHYAPAAAGRHAIFAVKNSNGTFTLTAVAWESVTRVIVRGLKILPKSIFRE